MCVYTAVLSELITPVCKVIGSSYWVEMIHTECVICTKLCGQNSKGLGLTLVSGLTLSIIVQLLILEVLKKTLIKKLWNLALCLMQNFREDLEKLQEILKKF